MPTYACERPVCLAKKLGGLLPLVLGIQLAAPGLDGGSAWLIVVGVLLTASGLALPVVEIIRRNRDGLP
ncbi:MAG: hypothetical protein IRZ13_13785 [Acetobacteraceae bacterium]|nr:hypothetical protein [Acetobacteraceae bacterium]